MADQAEKNGNPLADAVENVTEKVGEVASAVADRVTSIAKGDGDKGNGREQAATTASTTEEKGLPEYLRRRRTEVGRVVSDKMERTVVVLVERRKSHPIYKKIMRRSIKFMAHDETGAGIGDTVRIIESRPLSKRKRWQVVEILQRAE